MLLQFQMQNNPARRNLPPGIEDDVVFGILWIRVGAFKTVKPAPTSHKVNIQFWGEASPATLYTSQPNPAPLEYDVKCPVTFFEKYLLDMKKNLKIQVESIGNVFVDLTKYLKKNITLTTKSPFEHFKGFFEVIGKNNKKAGSLELEFCANFNPEIALRELDGEEQQEACPASKVQGCFCRGQCRCRPNKVTALDVIAVENPALFRDFYEQSKEKTSPKKPIQIQPVNDNRIPNSLNNLPNKGAFDPNKYTEPLGTPKVGGNFPTVEKILTYSNLKLKKEEDSAAMNRESSRPISIKDHLVHPSEPISRNVLKLPTPAVSRQQFLSQQISKPTGVFANERKPSEGEFRRAQDPRPATFLPVMQGRNQGNLSEVSEVEKMDESVSVEAQKEILSRVVNLNQQLERERKVSPKKVAERDSEQPFRQKFIETQDLKPSNNLPAPPMFAQNYSRPQKRKPSSLLLNMVVQLQTNTVSFGKKDKYILSYRPYGQKENIRTGPQFPSNFIMMFPVGEPQIAKMNKIPFILEFWSANDGSLLGVVKLSLAKIHKGFILQGRLNELAIKTNLAPTVIHRGPHAISDLVDSPVGECYLSAHLGTAAQIQTYLNNPTPLNVPSPKPTQQQHIPEKQQPPPPQSKAKSKGTLQDFTNLLQLIDSNTSKELSLILLRFMGQQEVDRERFGIFLAQLSYKGGDIFDFLASTPHKIQCKDLNACYDDYKMVKQAYLSHASKLLATLTNSQLSSIMQKIKERSNFGLISKQNISSILNNSRLDIIKSCLNDIIDSSAFIEWFKSAGKIPLKQIKVSEQISRPFIEDIFLKEVPNCMKIIDDDVKQNKNPNGFTVAYLRTRYERSNKASFSGWFWVHLVRMIYDSFGQEYEPLSLVNPALVYNWLALKQRERQAEPAEAEGRQIQQNAESQSQIRRQEGVVIEEQPRQPSPKVPERSKQIEIAVISEPIPNNAQINQINKENKQANTSNERQKKEKEVEAEKPQQKLIEHKFTISLQELQLEQDFSGDCTIFYRFPFEQEQISSRKIQLLREKHKYKLACSGTHKFTINQPIEQYLGESTLSVRVAVGKEAELYGDLHSEELVTKGSEYRVLPLFSSSREGMVGKVKIRIQYLQEAAQQAMLGRETIRDVFLPKSGYLNFQMSTTVDQSRLRQQFNFKDEFYIQISLDLFGENTSLSSQFPPFHSKLYSDFTSQLSLGGSIKLSLTPQILQHLRSGSCHARMHAIYYAKEKASYQKKDLLVASFKAPLFAVIREDGLRGDYAFKNRLGMFVSLAHSSIKYEKTARMQDRANQGRDSRESYWLVIDFTEIINFQGDLGGVKFEIVLKGKRYSTDKAFIREMGAFTLQSKTLCLQMGEQEFSLAKIISLSVIAGSEKFGIDINLRPIGKALGRQKYAINSHYFLVIDDQSRCKKIRIGTKIYAFRGQASLGPFVEAIAKSNIRDQGIAWQKEQEYQQGLQTLRKELKMSSKAFQDALSQFLDKKKKERLPAAFFTSKIHANLELTPIITFNQADIELLAEELPSEIDQKSLLDYIDQAQLKLLNLRPEFLQRYSFGKLNQTRLDQNVEYLNLNQEIDLLVFVSKVRVQQPSRIEEDEPRERVAVSHRMLRVSIIRGYNFHLLYNGIMPNSRISLPEIGLETDLVERTAEPVFNEHINFQPASADIRKIRVQVYHQPSEDGEAMMIGEGALSLSEALSSSEVPFSKVTRVVLTSLMSSRMQAALDVKIEVTQRQEAAEKIEKSYSEMDESIGDSRVEEAMQRIQGLNDYRRRAALFESSDQD